MPAEVPFDLGFGELGGGEMTVAATYTPPPFVRYLAITSDPNSSLGGTNLEMIAEDTAHFPSGVIPDVTSYAYPAITANHAWTPQRISRANEVTSFRSARPDIPFKVTPSVPFTVNSYRWVLEKMLKSVMGSEGAVVGTGPYTHPLSPLPMGSTIQPSLMMQLIRDSVNLKMIGTVLESVALTFPYDGPGTIQCEAYPMYSKLVTTTAPTGVQLEPAAEPMVVRDAVVVFDGGSATSLPISEFRFGYKNQGAYDRHIAGHCIDTNSIGATPIARRLWYPGYHRVSGRQQVTWGLSFLDAQQAQEVAAEWGQIQRIDVTLTEPGVSGNQIVFTKYAAEIEDGGVDALVATGDQTAAINGNAFYSSTDGADILVSVTNTAATAIAA